MRKLTYLCLSLFFCVQITAAQNVTYAQQIIDSLSSPSFDGRGYVNQGDNRAAVFIRSQMKDIGLEDVTYHKFTLNVNTFPGALKLETDQKVLTPGIDYLVDPASASIKTDATKLVWINESYFESTKSYKKLLKMRFKSHLVVVDTVGSNEEIRKRRTEYIEKYTGNCIIEIRKDLTWSVARNQEKKAHLWVVPGVLNEAQTLAVEIEAKFINGYKTRNVVGRLTGTSQPDSFVVLTGHYDHLGRMGLETYMPGANDNASGIAMILDMAKYFVENPPSYSVVFIAFAAEEAGLVGSYHFVQDRAELIDFKRIKFLVNMDLMGSGEQGIMAVNGKVFTDEYDKLDSINRAHNYLTEVRSRGKAANSDHYFFTEAGVHAFFFYLMGEYAFYHDVDDSSQNLRLSESSYSGAFKLIRDFINEMMH